MQESRLRNLLFFVLFPLLLSPAFSQDAADIEALLGKAEVSCEQAVWFTLAMALDDAPKEAQAAFSLALDRGWLPAQARSDTPISYSSLSQLVMKAFDVKGGMMYRLLGNPRYAYRELKALGYIPGRVYSSQLVSGVQFLQILGNFTGESWDAENDDEEDGLSWSFYR
jgi:hypothetical protein